MRHIQILRLLLTVWFCHASTPSQAAPAPVISSQREADGVTFRLNPGVLKLQVCTDKIVRVVAAASDSLPTNKSFVVIAEWKRTPFKLDETKTSFTVRTKSLLVRVDKADGAVTFADAAGKVLLAEKSGINLTSKPEDVAGLEKFTDELTKRLNQPVAVAK